jgi:uncharacterized protein (TIGR00251 family)
MISSKQMRTEIIKLVVKPNSKVTDVCGIYMNRIKIKLAAPPQRGKANKELIKFIAGKIDVPRKFIKIISGAKSNYKEISIKTEKSFDLTSKILAG